VIDQQKLGLKSVVHYFTGILRMNYRKDMLLHGQVHVSITHKQSELIMSFRCLMSQVEQYNLRRLEHSL